MNPSRIPLPMVLMGAVIAAACNPRPPLHVVASSDVPPSWVATSAPAAESPAAECANWAQDSWDVALTPDSATLQVFPASAERSGDSLSVADGVLVGSDRGEFGGSIWLRRPDRRHDTLRVQGRDSGAYPVDNLHSFIEHQGAVYALVGLAHMIAVGELLVLSRNDGRWSARHLLSLDGAPAAVTRAGRDTILVATTGGAPTLVVQASGDTIVGRTTPSLISIRLDQERPTQRVLHSNGSWSFTYPSSMVRDRAGVLYLGTRSAVVRLTPTGAGYREEWLVPAQCRRRVLVVPGEPCRCEATQR